MTYFKTKNNIGYGLKWMGIIPIFLPEKYVLTKTPRKFQRSFYFSFKSRIYHIKIAFAQYTQYIPVDCFKARSEEG